MKPTRIDILQHMKDHAKENWIDIAIDGAIWAADQTELSNALYIQRLENTIKNISEILKKPL